ncbi:14484_t:CDS:2 [Entrophospora sp. SA101]|nr:14484_t:CDS:2 [Entrophospora sp. SA101]
MTDLRYNEILSLSDMLEDISNLLLTGSRVSMILEEFKTGLSSDLS